MNFFEYQDQARRNTFRLLIAFTLAVVVLTGALYGICMVGVHATLLWNAAHRGNVTRLVNVGWWYPQVLGATALGTLTLLAFGAWIKTRELGGGASVALSVGGRWIPSDTQDPAERRLVNIVEEMAIASGVRVPTIFLLDKESGINAFAAGYQPNDAAIAVTAGAMQLLAREELQGVIAHEFSHILNGDMRLGVRMIGILYGFVMIQGLGRVLIEARTSRRGNANIVALLGLALLIVGALGVMLARVIKAAVSRQREYLADASAVQFTRSLGLAMALKKIGGYKEGARVRAIAAEHVSHLFFAHALRPSLLLETHPPLTERIKRMDPNFHGNFPRVALPTAPPLLFMPDGDTRMVAGLVDRTPIPLPATAVAERMSAPTPAHLTHGARLISELPPSLRAAAQEPFGAVALIYSLLLDTQPTRRSRQLLALAQNCHPALLAETKKLVPHRDTLSPAMRLPLVDLAAPSLERLAQKQYAQFAAHVRLLVEEGGGVDLFSFMLQKILARRVEPALYIHKPRALQFYTAAPLRDDLVMLLSALAHAGRDDPEGARAAFAAGAAAGAGAGPQNAREQWVLVPRERCTFAALDKALDRVALATPMIRKTVLDRCAQVVMADRQVAIAEAELLHAVADALECPLPPFLPSLTPAP